MSTFATQPIPEPNPVRVAPTVPNANVDDLIAQNRARTPKAAIENRSKPRLSIKELNEMDTDELRDRFLRTGPLDDRHPVQKVLDIIDLPRNTNANILFGHPTAAGIAGSIAEGAGVGAGIGALSTAWSGPGAAVGAGVGALVGGGLAAGSHVAAGIGRLFSSDSTKEAIVKDKEEAAGGQPRIYMSDALSKLGVENRVASAILGFAGDVLIDPLTYAGPAGGAKSIGGTLLRGAGGKALKASVKQAAVGGVESVTDEAFKGIMRAAGIGNEIRDAKAIRAMTEEGIKKYSTLAKTAENVAEHPHIDAYDNLLKSYGRGTGGGIKIGEGGSEVAHLPGTDLTLQVPGFTPTGQVTTRQFQRLRDASIAVDVLKNNPGLAAVKADLDGMRQAVSEYHAADAAGLSADPSLYHQGSASSLAVADISERMDRIAQAFRETAPKSIEGMNTHTVLQMEEMRREAKTLHDLANGWREVQLARGNPDGLAEAYRNVADAALKYHEMLGGSLSQHLDQGTIGAVETVKHALGVSDDIMGTTLLGKVGTAMSRVSGETNAVTKAVRSADRQVRTLFGLRSGSVPNKLADVHYRITADARRAEAEVADQMRREIGGIMAQHGIPASMADNVHALATMYGYREAARKLNLNLAQTVALKRVQNGKLVPSELHTGMQTLIKDLHDAGVGAEFHKALRGVAAKAADALSTYGDKEQAEYLLHRMIPGYIPNVTTREAEAMLSVKEGSGLPFDASAPAVGNIPKERFQRARSTQVFQFQHPETGEWMEFLGMDRDAISKGPEEMAALARDNPKDAARIEEMRRIISTYDKLAEAGSAPPPKIMSIFDLNAEQAKGRFGPLSVGDANFFEPGLPSIIGRRAGMHERAMARAELAHIINDVGMPADYQSVVNLARDTAQEHVLPNGEVATIIPSTGRFGGKVPIVVARGQRYRFLDRNMAGYVDNPIIGPLYDGAKGRLIPEQLADKIEDVARVFKDDQLEGVLKHIDTFTGLFKGLTLFRPSWTIGDIVGNVANAASGGLPLKGMAERLKDAYLAKLADHRPDLIPGLRVQTATGELAGQAALDYFRKTAFDKNIPAEIGLQMSQRGLSALPSQTRRVGVLSDLTTDAQYAANQYAQSLGKVGGAAAGGLRVGWDRINRFALGPWVRANAFVNDVVRGAAVLALHDAGHDIDAANAMVRRVLFDYHDLTHFERRYMKNLVPFYSWVRSNLPFQLQQLFLRPGYVNAIPKVQNAIEEAIDGEQRVPMNLRPRWMRGAVMTQIGANPESRIGLALDNSVPQGDLLHALSGVVGWDGAQEMMHYFGSSTNPAIQIPLAIGSGREYFSGRSIGADTGEGDMTTGEFLANQVGPVSFGKGVARAAGKGLGYGAGKFLIGGRIQDFDESRIRTTRGRDFRDRADGARRAAIMAERSGDKDASLKARVRLLKVYQSAIDAGVEEEAGVPKWAREAITNMAQTAN